MASTRSLLVLFGDGGSPETFATVCSINTTRSFELTATTSDFVEPNCADPDGINWQGRIIDIMSGAINGAGTMDPPSYGTLRDIFLAGEPVNCQVKLDLPSTDGGGHYEGPFVMTTLGAAKETARGVVTCTVALQSAGAITWVDATP